MSETALTPPDEMPTAAPERILLDGDTPRLGSMPLTAPAPMGGVATTPIVNDAPPAPTLPVASPVLSDPVAPMQTPMQSGADVFAADMPAPVIPAAVAPSIPAPALPTLPTAAPASPTAAASPLEDGTDSAPTAAGAEHPMAHLMGSPTKVSEASQRAAELRAAKKAKAKKIKIGFAVGALVFSAVVGPPLWSWFTNALNETGTTSSEEPAD